MQHVCSRNPQRGQSTTSDSFCATSAHSALTYARPQVTATRYQAINNNIVTRMLHTQHPCISCSKTCSLHYPISFILVFVYPAVTAYKKEACSMQTILATRYHATDVDNTAAVANTATFPHKSASARLLSIRE